MAISETSEADRSDSVSAIVTVNLVSSVSVEQNCIRVRKLLLFSLQQYSCESCIASKLHFVSQLP